MFFHPSMHPFSIPTYRAGWRVTPRTSRRSIAGAIEKNSHSQLVFAKMLSMSDVQNLTARCRSCAQQVHQVWARRVMSLSFLGIITTLVLYMAKYVIPEV